MSLSAEYTITDHQFRDSDSYAGAKYEITLRWLNKIAPSGDLLNIGCGAGLFNDMASAAGYTVFGFEPDSEPCKLAQQRANERYEVENAGVEGVKRKGDIVVMHDVLEHIEDDAGTRDKIYSFLNPGGVAIISVPAMPSLFGLHDEQLGHYRRYTRRKLCRLFSERFEMIHIRSFGAIFIPITWWFSRVRRKPYPMQSDQKKRSLLGGAFDLACSVESRIPLPCGTSLVCAVRKPKT